MHRNKAAKRTVCFCALLLCALLLLCSCGRSLRPTVPASSYTPEGNTAPSLPGGDAALAFVATTTQRESAFGQEIWAAISRFAGEEGLLCNLYRTEDGDPTAAAATVELAITGGAELVVAVGDELAPALLQAQQNYPDVDFLLVDAARTEPAAGGAQLRFDGMQAGWLAGYTAVQSGARRVSFAEAQPEDGGDAYALGFLQGAEDAAAALGLPAGGVGVCALPLSQEVPLEERRAQFAAFFNGEPAVFFASTPTPAAQAEAQRLVSLAGGSMMGMGMDLSVALPYVLASADKTPSRPMYEALQRWRSGSLPAGGAVWCGLAEDAVDLVLLADTADLNARTVEDAKEQLLLPETTGRLHALAALVAEGAAPTLQRAGLTHLAGLDVGVPVSDSLVGGAAPVGSEPSAGEVE